MAAVGEWRLSIALHEDIEPELVRFLRVRDGIDAGVPSPTDAAPDPEQAGPVDGVTAMCKAFPGTTPDYWMTGISERDIDELCKRLDRGNWATCDTRKHAIDSYLNAVKWIRKAHGK
jgi:hypothetical protein